jgi:FMN phosphatase YigB (HAD superfamily)
LILGDAYRVKRILQTLSELGYWNIVLSDNEVSGDVIFKRLNENYGIGPFLKDVISSVDTKCCKPSSVFFNFALKKWDLNVKNGLFVGHDFDEIEGANKFGIKTVLFNNYLDRSINSDYIISDFEGLTFLAEKIFLKR